MALIKSISGIRGTIGGKPGDNLTPPDVVKFAAAYGTWLKQQHKEIERPVVVVGRDGRISGKMVKDLVNATLTAVGIDVLDADFTTTPTIEMAVTDTSAQGGIILTASHNPKEWNALKLLNDKGEFISGEEGSKLLEIAERESFSFVSADAMGSVTLLHDAIEKHIAHILALPLVDVEAIKAADFKVVADVINSTGSIALPKLFDALGVSKYTLLNGDNTGVFAHNPEPLPEHLVALSREVTEQKAHLGIAVDPDVDRLCFVCDDGSMFGEEYTLVAVADYILQHKKGNTVSNMSSTRALQDVTEKHGCNYAASAVGEVNVVEKMKSTQAIIGGEGNGGIILPELHYGRDALAGIALFLTQLAKFGKSVKQLRSTYPDYFMSKNKISLTAGTDVKSIFEKIKTKYKNQPMHTEDGLKIEFDKDWVHLRTSNTEPIIRIYSESNMETTARNIANRLVKDIQDLLDNKEL